jgi:hypothetical protein
MKAKINLLLEGLLLLVLAVMGGTGLLMKYVLVAGSVRRQLYGSSAEFLWQGMDRHEWASIHSTIALGLVLLLVLHVVLHWATVVRVARQLLPQRGLRWATAGVLVAAAAALAGFSAGITPQVREPAQGQGQMQSAQRGQGRGARRRSDLDPAPTNDVPRTPSAEGKHPQ